MPDFPKHRTWGCSNCNAAFFKDTPRNRSAFGGLVPCKWPNDQDKKDITALMGVTFAVK